MATRRNWSQKAVVDGSAFGLQNTIVTRIVLVRHGHVEGIAGATILGNGSVALILDVASLTRRPGEVRAA